MIFGGLLRNYKRCDGHKCGRLCALYTEINGKTYCTDCFAKWRSSHLDKIGTLEYARKLQEEAAIIDKSNQPGVRP